MIDAMTCKDDVGKFLKVAGTSDNIAWSFKMDGVRLLAIVDEKGPVQYFSRTKKNYNNFSVFDPSLVELAIRLRGMGLPYPIIFDGEAMAKERGFSKIMTQLRRLKDVDMSIFEFNVFDIVTPGVLAERFNILRKAFTGYRSDTVKLLGHYVAPEATGTAKGIEILARQAVAAGYEGVVLKTLDGEYEHKRSGLWCKVKMSEHVDVKVVGYELGSGRLAGMVGALICQYEGKEIRVGSGFSDADRVEFLKALPDIIEVKYQERTNTGALRFPTFMRVRDDKDEVSA